MDLWSSILESGTSDHTSDVYLARLSTSLSGTEPIRINPEQGEIVKLYRSIHHAIDALSISDDIPTGTKVTVFKPKYDISIDTPSIDECPYANLLDEVWTEGAFDMESVGEYIIIDNRSNRHTFDGGSVVESIISEVYDEPIVESSDDDSVGSIDDVYESILTRFVTEADGDDKKEEDDDKTTRDTMRDARKDLNDDLGDEEPLDEEQSGEIPKDDEATDTDDTNTDNTADTQDSTEGNEEGSDSDAGDSDDSSAGDSDSDGMDDDLGDMDESGDSDSGDSSDADTEGDSTDSDSDSTDDSADGESTDGDPNADKNKKINKINLLKDFISLYKTIENSNKKLTEARKDNILTSVTINQVRKNLTRLGEVVYNYHSINLYNFKYFSEILKLNVDMLRTMQNNEDNGQTNS